MKRRATSTRAKSQFVAITSRPTVIFRAGICKRNDLKEPSHPYESRCFLCVPETSALKCLMGNKQAKVEDIRVGTGAEVLTDAERKEWAEPTEGENGGDIIERV